MNCHRYHIALPEIAGSENQFSGAKAQNTHKKI
jgi:hypothetical protein